MDAGTPCWDASLLPETAAGLNKVRNKWPREKANESVGAGRSKGASANEKQGFRGILDSMIERKLAHFAEYGRAIIDFELTDIGTGYHLPVVSTMESPRESGLDNEPGNSAS
jgi:hypothetical protein